MIIIRKCHRPLYLFEGEPEIKIQNDMLELGYREPEKLYYCLTIELLAEEEWLGTLNPEAIEDIRGQFNPIVGYPVTISWLSFVERLQEWRLPGPGQGTGIRSLVDEEISPESD